MKFEEYNHLCVIRPEGDLAGPEADALRRAAEARVGRGNADVVIDLQATPFISGTGLEALLDVKRRCDANGGRLRLTRLPGNCRQILRLTRLEDRFECHAQLPDGISR